MVNQNQSQILAHAGYMIAIVIGALTLISRFDAFAIQGSVWTLVFVFFLSSIASIVVFTVGRLFYWTSLNCFSYSITETEFSEYHNKHPEDGACLSNFQNYLTIKIRMKTEKQPQKLQDIMAGWSTLQLAGWSATAFLIMLAPLMVIWAYSY